MGRLWCAEVVEPVQLFIFGVYCLLYRRRLSGVGTDSRRPGAFRLYGKRRRRRESEGRGFRRKGMNRGVSGDANRFPPGASTGRGGGLRRGGRGVGVRRGGRPGHRWVGHRRRCRPVAVGPAAGRGHAGRCCRAPATWLAWLAWRGDTRTDAAALICGALLIGWIGVELIVVREVTVLHTAGVLVGAVLIGVGRRGSGEPAGPGDRPVAGVNGR